jgi:hypothetical protein
MLLASIGVAGYQLWISNGSTRGRRTRGKFQQRAFFQGMIGGMIGGYDKMTMYTYAVMHPWQLRRRTDAKSYEEKVSYETKIIRF